MEQYSNTYSEELQEIIGRRPSWILRWGLTVILCIVIGTMIACYLIKYPQTVMSYAYLTSNNPPSDLVSRNTGILDSVYVSDGSFVNNGQLIALISNAAEYNDIVIVENLLSKGLDSFSVIVDEVVYQSLNLGDIQQGWVDLVNLSTDYKDYIGIDQVGKKKIMLSEQILRAEEYFHKLEVQRITLIENLQYESTTLARDSILLSRKVISQAEYDNSLKNYAARKNSLASFDASMSNAQLERLQLEQQIQDLEIKRLSDAAEYKRRLTQIFNKLISDIALWKQQFAIISPYDGVVSLQNVWTKGQHINAGDLIASVTPQGGENVIGKLKVPSNGFGKIEPGQNVIIKLNAFPYMEFGIVRGIVKSISSVPEATAEGLCYTIEVSLPNGLQSTYNKKLPFVQNMDGIAEVVVEDRRLIEQFIMPIISLFKNK